MENTKALESLGLSEKESAVYLALLELGKSNVTQIASLSRLKRPTVYVLLEELRKKRLVLKVPHAKNALFIPQDPDEFFNESLARVKSAYSTLSELKAIHKKDDKITTKYFDGEEGVRDALFYRYKELSNEEVVGFFAKGETLTPRLRAVCHEWREKMHETNATLRGIAPEHATLKEFRDTDTALGQLFKTIPFDQYSSDVSIDATKFFVRIVLFNVKQAIIIENPAIVKTVQQIFEIAWKNVK